MGRVIGYNHASFGVTDLKRTMAYFTEVLGFSALDVSPRDPKLVQKVTSIPGSGMIVGYVQGFGQKLELIQYTGPDDRGTVQGRPCDAGFAHIAVDVEGMEDLLEKLAAHGLRPLGGIGEVFDGPNSGKRATYLRDWDGVSIELIETMRAAT